MSDIRRKWTVDAVHQEAAKYQSRSDFANGSKAAYSYAWKKGWLDLVCSHMPISPKFSYKKWTAEDARSEAKKYKSRSAFKKGNSGAYCFLLDSGVLDSACEHMDQRNWTLSSAQEEAKKYRTKDEFRRGSGGAYCWAYRTNRLDEICSHMDIKRQKWTKATVAAEAARFLTRSEFFYGSTGAYNFAYRRGWLDDVCSHMEEGEYGFSDGLPATLYVLKIVAHDVIYKVGITNRNVSLRINGMGLFPGVQAEILSLTQFGVGRDARVAERRLKKELMDHKYDGPPVMANGNTELFTVNILPLMGDLLEPLAA